jgi:flagellar biosynthesis protein FlhG
MSTYLPKILAMCSGKGGVGKSFIASSLACSIARTGLKVTLVDLDLNGGNLHTILGIHPNLPTLSNWFQGHSSKLNEFEQNTNIPNLKLILGRLDSWGRADLTDVAITRFQEALKTLNTDIIILDLNGYDEKFDFEMLKIVDETILVTTPEPSSIEKTYRWIESYLNENATLRPVLRNFEDDKKTRNTKIICFETYAKEKGAEIDLQKRFREKRLNIIINQVRSYDDEALGLAIKSVLLKRFGIPSRYIGFLQYDNAVWQCVRKRAHLYQEQPYNALIGQFLSMSKHLVDPTQLKAVG